MFGRVAGGADGAVDAEFAAWGGWYREWWAEGVWEWTAWGCEEVGCGLVRGGSGLGLLPRCELRMSDLVGMLMGMDWLIFLMRLLTMAAEDLRGSSRPPLGGISRLFV